MPLNMFTKKQVISASRRTDIPAFYMEWFMDSLGQGCFDVENPYNKKRFRVTVTPDNTHTIVFWSKNFGPFLDGNYGEDLRREGYHLFFNFTVNSHDPLLEPNVPPMPEKLVQMRELARRFDPRAVTWRFDPICHYRDNNGQIQNNLSDFSLIAGEAAKAGITRCVTSFADLYSKVMARTVLGHPGFSFSDLSMEDKILTVLSMESRLSLLGIRLDLCCEKDLLSRLPGQSKVNGAACIPNDELIGLFGGGISRAKDSGQRKSKGCGCSISKDIGSYRLQPCFHNCLFCYANPMAPKEGQP